MKKNMQLSPIYIACFLALAGARAAYGAPLDFAQTPPSAANQEPIPNVILSVDDSGSMTTRDADAQGTTRMEALKQALKNQFGDGALNKGKVPDNKIRLAWQTMNNGSATSITPGGTNAMRSFSGNHRANFARFVDALYAQSGTPSHRVFLSAHRYMLTPPGSHSPFADNPDSPSTYLACRRSYHIFMTDGKWYEKPWKASSTDAELRDETITGNIDGTPRVLGDGTTQYTPNTTQTQIYSDIYGAGNASALADWAFLSWAMDLQPNIENKIQPLMRKKRTQKIGGVSLEPFWNPRNDPATWQHLTTHTIGFGAEAAGWSGQSPRWDASTDDNYRGDYPNLINGSVKWGNPSEHTQGDSYLTTDLTTQPGPFMATEAEAWHSALNGRGKYYPARSAATLDKAFASILDNIYVDTSKPIMSLGASSRVLKTDTNIYLAGYIASDWSGIFTARSINAVTAEVDLNSTWDAAAKLNAKNPGNRFIVSYNGLNGFLWNDLNNLNTLQKNQLNKNNLGSDDGLGADRLQYLRGNKSKEESEENGVFRDRESILGDIVNSSVWHVGSALGRFDSAFENAARNRTKIVYVGANDGMLHGFNAANGEEVLAYIPQGIAENHLRNLTDVDYIHRYYVDGPVFGGDIKVFNNNHINDYKTYVTGSLGAGGTGYFILDVTNPSSLNASNLVHTDATALKIKSQQTQPPVLINKDDDIGHIFSPPALDDAIAGKSRQFIRLNNNRPALILGNGYNSSSEKAVLIIQYLDEDKKIIKISTDSNNSVPDGNGLSTPQPIDLNGDGKIDVVYAGDLQGNLWKFDLTSCSPNNWKLASIDGNNNNQKPLFTAKHNGQNQAITTAPIWVQHPLGGLMLVFGTGRLLTQNDQTLTQTQTIYGLYDSTEFSNVKETCGGNDFNVLNIQTTKHIDKSKLVEQTMNANSVSGIYYQSSSNDVDYQTKNGWYFNYALPGQRVIRNPEIFSGQLGLIWSVIPTGFNRPTAETCEPVSALTGQRDFITILNLITGKPSKNPVLSTSNSAITTEELSNMQGGGLLLKTEAGFVVATPKCNPADNCPPTRAAPRFVSSPITTGKNTGWRIIRQ